MNIIIPISITAAMIQPGTSIAEPDLTTGEAAWVSGGTYALGDERIRSTTHRVYECVQAHTGRPTLPEVDSAYWLDKRATQRWQPFDVYITTAASAVGSATYVLQPGFFNAVALYGMIGSGVAVTAKDAPGGTIVRSYSGDLFEQALGLYELLFVPMLPREKLVIKDIPLGPTTELTITVSADVGDPVAIGMIDVGDYRPVIGTAEWGGTQYGAGAELKDFSYIKFWPDGTTEIKQKGSATDLRGSVVMPASAADFAVATVRQVLGRPVACIATDATGYDYLNTFGLISASATADNHGSARLDYSVKGFI